MVITEQQSLLSAKMPATPDAYLFVCDSMQAKLTIESANQTHRLETRFIIKTRSSEPSNVRSLAMKRCMKCASISF